MNTSLEAHKCGIGVLTREALVPIGSGPNTWGPIYGMSAPELTEMKRYVTTYLANGFIRPSKSPAAAPVMFFKRPAGKLRLVVDYRGLNKVTIKNRFPLPLIPEMLDRLHLAKVFTKIDLKNSYHHVRVKGMNGRLLSDVVKDTLNTRSAHKVPLTRLLCFNIL